MLLNVITVRGSPDLSNKTLVPSQSLFFFSSLSLDWQGTPNLIPNSHPERQFLISRHEQNKYNHLSTVSFWRSGSTELRTQPVDTWSR